MWNLKILAVTGTLIATSLAGTAWYAHSKGRQQGKETVQAMWNAERLAVATAQAEEAAKARQKEQTLQTLLAQQRKEHQNEVRRLARDLGGLRDPYSLTNSCTLSAKPDTASGLAPAPAPGRLSVEASEFLLEFARDADRAAEYAATCYRWTEEVNGRR